MRMLSRTLAALGIAVAAALAALHATRRSLARSAQRRRDLDAVERTGAEAQAAIDAAEERRLAALAEHYRESDRR